MTYDPKTFPVKVVRGKRYSPSTGRGRRACTDFTPWWSDDTFHQQRGDVQHNAIDIMAPLGARVVAPRAGRVLGQGEWVYQGERRSGAGWSERGGWYIRIATYDGGTDYFAHLQYKALVNPNDRVVAGQLLGYVGQTGNATLTCPHLHYQVKDALGRYVDPVPKLSRLFDQGDYITSASWTWLWFTLFVGGAGYAGIRLAKRKRR